MTRLAGRNAETGGAPPRVLLNCSITSLEDMLAKGNVWYTLHYREHFDRYVCGYLLGRPTEAKERDGVYLVSLGTGRPALDLLLAPLRVYRLAKRVGATDFMSADLILAWWHFLLLRLTGARLMVMPVCNPEVIIETSGRPYSGLPAPVERFLIRLSFRTAARILCVATNPTGVEWIRSTPFQRKLMVVDVLPEDFSSPEFLGCLDDGERFADVRARLIFVGRLEKEKLVDDLLDAMEHLAKLRPFQLTIVGDGSERARLEERARAAGLVDRIEFAGFLPAREVAARLMSSDVCVSPYTGTTLREAALAGVATVAYRLGGIEHLFSDGKNCVLVEAGDTQGLASAIAHLIDAPERRRELGQNARMFARQLWSLPTLRRSLAEAFAP